MKIRTILIVLAFVSVAFLSHAQNSLDVSSLAKPATNAWPTYHGDYSGRHFSPLNQINIGNAKNLSLAWIFRTSASTQGAIVGGTPQPPNAGRGNAAFTGRGANVGPEIKSIPLMVNGVAYLSTTNNVWAIDARSGREIWHYVWQGRSAIGNRGVAMYGKWLYLETGDNSVVSLDAATGAERWHKPLAPPSATNFSTSAPVVIRNHVILGVGGDSGTNNTWVESRDPETGEVQWKWMVTPSAGEPGIETWPSAEASANGAGGPWQPGTYDPDLNLFYVPTGNPTPTYNGPARKGSNLYTSSLVALNPDTGKMVWYYQFSPHDTHDWDATQTPVLIDGTIDGKPRKLVALANRNGYYFLLDRTTGKSVVVKPFIETTNAYKSLDKNGVLIPDVSQEPSPAGSLVSPDSDGADNYPAPTFDPQTGLFYVNSTSAFSIFYLPVDPNDASGFGRGSEYHTGTFPSSLRALDYRTGALKWEHKYEDVGFWSSTYPGMLSTSGGVLFTGDPSGNFIAFDAANGKILWHCPLGGTQSNTPETFMLDGHQYVVVAGVDALYAFYLQ